MLTDYFNSSEAFPPTAGGENWWAGKRYLTHPTNSPPHSVAVDQAAHWSTLCVFVCSPASTRVVELGAGTGIPGIFLASKGARVVLTDLPDVRVNTRPLPYAHRATVSLVSTLSTTHYGVHSLLDGDDNDRCCRS